MQRRTTPSGWYADPQGRFEYRYFNGVHWTSDVAVDGQRYVDTPPDPPAQLPQASRPRRGMAIASFVTALGGVLLGWVPFVFVVAAGAAITAIVFGVVGLRTSRQHGGYGRGFAVAGLALAPVALAACIGGLLFTRAVVREIRNFVEPGPNEVHVDQPCTIAGGRATVHGTIRNLDTHPHDYRITVEFRNADTTKSATADVSNVVHNSTSPWSTSADLAGNTVTCAVTDVSGPLPFGVDQQS